jgi:PAS domain S-box-containing protein
MTKRNIAPHYDNCPVPVVIFEKTGMGFYLVYWNQAMADVTAGHIVKSKKNADELFARTTEIVSDLKRCIKTKTNFQTERSHYFQHIDKLAYYVANYHYLPENKVEVFLVDITKQKLFEKAIILGKEKMKTLVENSDFILATYDRQYKISSYYGPNRYVRNTEQVLDRKMTELLNKKEAEQIEINVKKVFQTGKPVEQDNNYTIAGKDVWINECFYPIPGGDKDGIELVGYIGRDVTEVRKIRLKLEESEQRYTKVFEKSKDGICFCESKPAAKGKVLTLVRDANPAFCGLLGMTAGKLIGNRIQDVFPELSRMRFNEEEHNGPYEIIRTGTGKILKLVVIRLQNDGYVLMAEDITDKKNSELRLQQSEKKYREITDLIRVIILETDPDLQVVFANLYASKKLFGRTSRPEEPVSLMDMVEPNDRDKIRMSFQDIIAGKETEMKAFHMRNSEGVRMFVLSNAVQILDGEAVAGVRIAIFELNEIASTIIFPDNELNKKYGLSKRESDVLFSLISGLTDQDIAEKLFISKPTVRFHITNLYNKLGVNRKKELFDFMKGNFVQKLGYENLLIYILNSFLKE